MPSSTIDGQWRTDWIQQNLLSTAAAVSGWKQFSSGGSTVDACQRELIRCAHQSHDADAESHLSAILSVPSPRWVAELVECWFEVSGFGVDGLSGQGEMHSGKRATARTTVVCIRATASHRVEPSETQAEHSHVGQILLFLLWSVQSVFYWSAFFPGQFGLCTRLTQWLLEASGFWEVQRYAEAAGGRNTNKCTEWRRKTQLEEYLPSEW